MSKATAHLAVAAERLGHRLLVDRTARRARLAVPAALAAQAAVLAASVREAAQLAVLLLARRQPADLGVVADRGVRGVDADDLKVLARAVGVHPVARQDTQPPAAAAQALLGHALQVALELELADALVHGLAVHLALVHGALAVAAAHAHAVHHVALLRLVAQAARLVRAAGVCAAVDLGHLAVLPAADALQVAVHVRLLLAPQLLHVRVRAHG
mmetsp:Transcript_22603/g.69835  ORF Transcript_22603/g.69835 Transcript_22603/m.69835 type:complete len:214 (+) Transcript_22603:115-756(+)